MRIRIPKTNVAGVWITIIVTILLLIIFFSFIITGGVLLSNRVTPEAQLVLQYNNNVASWNSVVRQRISGIPFNMQFGSNSPVTLQQTTTADPIPPENNILPYTPFYYTISSQTLLDGSITYNSGQTALVNIQTSSGINSINVVLFQTFQQNIYGSSPQMQCDNLGGHFFPTSSICQTYWMLSGVCVIYNSLNNKLARIGNGNGCQPGLLNSSPFPNQWSSGIYTQLTRAPLSSGLYQPANMNPSSTGSLTIRDQNDPFVIFQELSYGTLSFQGVINPTNNILGIVFLSLSIVPGIIIFLIGIVAFGIICNLIIRSSNKTKRNVTEESQKGLLSEEVNNDPDKSNIIQEPESGKITNPLEYGNKNKSTSIKK